MKIVAIVLTRNEQLHIARCIERLRPLTTHVIVVDSFSTDETVAIAKAAGATVWQNVFVSHAKQFQWALDQLGDGADWIVRLDADEWIEPPAIAAFLRRAAEAPPGLSAFEIRRKVVFQGRWIRWGGYYRTILTRFWRAGSARIEQRWMDEHIVVEKGRVERITEGDVVDQNDNDLTFFTEKHNHYATRQVVDYVADAIALSSIDHDPKGMTPSARRKRFVRKRIYARLPKYLRSLSYFLYRYILNLGFLDGRAGLVFHVLQGFWYPFLVDAKEDEARRFVATHGAAAYRAMLEKRHNLTLGQ